MYLTQLRLTDIRCFAELTISLEPGESALILGDNGDGKTTLLRSLAMGLCDESSSAALFRELPGEFVRREPTGSSPPFGTIAVQLLNETQDRYDLQTRVVSLEAFERVTQHDLSASSRKSTLSRIVNDSREPVDQDRFPWEEVFVSAYGAGTRTQGTADFQHYLTVDAVYPLFNYTAPLQNPELSVRRFVDAARASSEDDAKKTQLEAQALSSVQDLLAPILNLDSPDCLRLAPTGIMIDRGPGAAELGELGDGYRATVTWVLDLLSWWLLYEADGGMVQPSEISGIVLIDEIEQHLHPRWQRTIMDRLTTCFPQVQFIATTHSPLVASGAEGLTVYRLEDGTVERATPYGWLAEDVYRFMGIDSSRAPQFDKLVRRYHDLHLESLKRGLKADEQRELARLRDELDKLPGTDPLAVSEEVKSMLEKMKSD